MNQECECLYVPRRLPMRTRWAVCVAPSRRQATADTRMSRIISTVAAVFFGTLFFTLLLRDYMWRLRHPPEEEEAERKALEQRILSPDWTFYERHLQRPAPTALRELFADRRLVTSCGLEFTKSDGISTFNPLDEDSLLDTADQLGYDVVPFATSDCG